MLEARGKGGHLTRQDLADALDAEILRRLLPVTAVAALNDWLTGTRARYAVGVGAHTVEYAPAHWTEVDPWPPSFGSRTSKAAAAVSRSQVVSAVQEATTRGAWPEALTASYIWGQGRTGYGPHRLTEILAQPRVSTSLEEAAKTLQEKGAVAAYRFLDGAGAVKGLGPAFFTKYLYFLNLTMSAPAGPEALILDQRVARTLRAHATQVAQSICLPSSAELAAWIWSDRGWTAHRYDVYLDWMAAASKQLEVVVTEWPTSAPDMLELALFNGAWDPLE
ncbi:MULTISPECIES: hypothetical protein [unclassified Kitasatospora]|uniref:8-oxoguanine DNA glycosylase OGG fold protein n=1 Tax=unclassified Kitasatospora TaxID=2633591 RepID=UPI0032AF060B